MNGITSLTRPSCGGGSGGEHSYSRGVTCTSCCAPNIPVLPGGGAVWSLSGEGGLLAGAVVAHLSSGGVEVPHFDILGAPLKQGRRLT